MIVDDLATETSLNGLRPAGPFSGTTEQTRRRTLDQQQKKPACDAPAFRRKKSPKRLLPADSSATARRSLTVIQYLTFCSALHIDFLSTCYRSRAIDYLCTCYRLSVHGLSIICARAIGRLFVHVLSITCYRLSVHGLYRLSVHGLSIDYMCTGYIDYRCLGCRLSVLVLSIICARAIDCLCTGCRLSVHGLSITCAHTISIICARAIAYLYTCYIDYLCPVHVHACTVASLTVRMSS